jgi:hypothetical protein
LDASGRFIVEDRTGGLGAGLFDFNSNFDKYLQPTTIEDVGDVGSFKSKLGFNIHS